MGNKADKKKRVCKTVDEDATLNDILESMAESLLEIQEMLCNIHLMFDGLIKFMKGQNEHEA